jgi:hypothetical protein
MASRNPVAEWLATNPVHPGTSGRASVHSPRT